MLTVMNIGNAWNFTEEVKFGKAYANDIIDGHRGPGALRERS